MLFRQRLCQFRCCSRQFFLLYSKMMLDEPEPEPEPEPEKTVLACPTYSCGDLADFQCTRGRSVVKFELEKTEYALFPSLIHQVNYISLKFFELS